MGSGAQRLVVSEADRGKRLDQFLQRALAVQVGAPTRGAVQRWIDAGAVTVNGTARKAAERVRPGDVVAVASGADVAPRTEAQPDASVAFDVVYVDDAVVVVNKPAGLVVHPARSHAGGTLVNGLLARGFFDAWDAKDDEGSAYVRPGIVHRIDKGTSGLLVVARTSAARESLKAQLMARTMLREYDALALGEVTVLEHDTPYGRHPTDRLRFSGRVRSTRRAVTRVEVVERFAGATWVRCRLRTGRTHQIRVHLAESGTPIVGDTTYGSRPRAPLLSALARSLGHQALHARLLGFVHPSTGEPMRFEAPLPADVARTIEALRAANG